MKITRSLATSMLVLIAAAINAAAATFTVTNTDDSGPGSLRQAVLDANAAPSADTIVFDSGLFSSPQTITLASEIRISDNFNTVQTLTIIGPGADLLTISGNGVTRMFLTIQEDTASISGMTLTGGNGSVGGAIQNGGITTLSGIVFTQNTSDTGGAIYNTHSGVLNVNGCVFRDNTTIGANINGDGGSAITNRLGTLTVTDSLMTGGTTRGGGGGLRSEGGVVNISNTTISNNTSGGAGNTRGGGGIYNNGEMTLTNCVVSGNTAGEDTAGGGIRNALKLTLINSIVTGNTATEGGGGIYGSGTTASGEFVTIINSTISNNSANTGTGSVGTGNGGGIYIAGGMTTTITGSTISGNTVAATSSGFAGPQGFGGGIFTFGTLTLKNTTVSGNSAENVGGGIYDDHPGGSTGYVTLDNSTIVNNQAGQVGGVENRNPVANFPVTIRNTIIANNTGGTSPDVRNDFNSQGYNLIENTAGANISGDTATNITGVDPNLGSLANNGGPTATHALLPGSPAIDKGKTSSDLTTDQRGVTRPTDDPAIANANGGDGSDIGAYEIGASNGVAEKTLGNIATRLPVLTGENVLIGGIIVVGEVPKRVIIRALGRSLGASGVSGTLEDPTLELFQGETLLVANDDWKDDQEGEIRDTGVQPSDDREAAIVRTLEPGSYTAVVRGKDDTTGVALVEAYDLDQRPDSKLANIATRGFVGSGEDVLIGGFIVGPTTKVVVRAIGPSLGNAGIEGALQDPTLDLVNANGQVIRTNDDWKGTQRAEIESIGIQPSDDRESALIATLTAGNYTAVVRGVGGNTGVGLVEVYNLQ